VERGSVFRSSWYGAEEYFKSVDSEVYPIYLRKNKHRDSEQEELQQQHQLPTDFSTFAKSFTPLSESLSMPSVEVKTK
jgi:hypothetical protein